MDQTGSSKKILEQLNTQMDVGKEIIKMNDYQIGPINMWYMRMRSLLVKIYKDDDPIIIRLKKTSYKIRKHEIPPEHFREMFSTVHPLVTLLNNSNKAEASIPCPFPLNKNVFIIHGHDEINTLRLQAILNNTLNLNPIVMKRKPGMSRHLLTKFEEVAEKCSFAIALFTDDDFVVEEKNDQNSEYKQARPNVINEAGWFIGRLGKERLLILLKDGAKIHTDYDGVSRIQFKESIEEKFLDIQEELNAAGLL